MADSIHDTLTTYSSNLDYETLSKEAIHAAKLRIIDTIGALVGGYFYPPCKVGRAIAAKIPMPEGSTVIGTTMKTSPDIAAFVNGTASRYAELNDTYLRHNTNGGHVSDVLMPVLSAAEYGHASGKDYILGATLAYEVFIRISDQIVTPAWDLSTQTVFAVAAAAAKMLKLSERQIHHAISMAVIPNNALRQGRTGELSMWKAVAAGQAGRGGVFAAMLAADGMEGCELPFEGTQAWVNHVAGKQFKLNINEFGSKDNTFKIEETLIKIRSACSATISSIMAAEKIYEQFGGPQGIDKVTVEVYNHAYRDMRDEAWDPQSRETADHSIPYVAATAICEGTVTPDKFDDAHVRNKAIRDIMSKMKVVENDEFTKDYESLPRQYRTHVTATKKNGDTAVGETGGQFGNWADPPGDEFVEQKFTGILEPLFGAKGTARILERLWSLEDMDDVSEIPEMLIL